MDRITVDEDGDRFAVCQWLGPNAGTIAYDRSGRRLFESGSRVLYPRFGLWFRNVYRSESTQVLNDSGRVIGVLPVIGSLKSSGDTLFLAQSHAGTIVFDRRARILWRDGVLRPGPCLATISSDGREVDIASWDSVIVHDLMSGKTTAKAVDSSTGPRRGLDGIAWSGDGRRVSMYRRDVDVPDSATLWGVNRDGRLASPARRLAASYTEHLFWMGDTVVLVASPYDPNMRKRMHDKPLGRGSCKVTAVALSGKTQEWTVPGLFGQLGGWHQQGRTLAYIDTELSYYAVFQVPVK
jgi:hypothetical protein